MCNKACLDFGRKYLRAEEIRGKAVLEVGSRDVNGSLRGLVGPYGPARYLGVDIEEGPGVDELCAVTDLLGRFGAGSFDVVISTEVFEHVRDWRGATENIKGVLRPGGLLILTTRSRGFPRHGYPHDWWRYEIGDMRAIFGDMRIEALEPDPTEPGVYLKSWKPADPAPRRADLSGIRLYSMVKHRRCRGVSDADVRLDALLHRLGRAISPAPLKRFVRTRVLNESLARFEPPAREPRRAAGVGRDAVGQVPLPPGQGA